MSHPSWVCGLKQSIVAIERAKATSHPSWVCGLKLHGGGGGGVDFVTPFVGVWIET